MNQRSRSWPGLSMLGAFGMLVLVSAVGCAVKEAPARGRLTAVWNARLSAPLALEDLLELERSGIDELFVEAADLSWESGAPELIEQFAPALPRATPATLVVTGLWVRPGASARAVARAWRDRVEELELSAERRRATPVGLHFELEIKDGGQELAAVLKRLRRELAGRLFLSVRLAPELLGTDLGRELAAAVDFVVVPGYGQPPGEVEVPARWDLQAVRPSIESLAATRTPFVLAGWTLGEATLQARGGEIRARTSALSLSMLLRDPRFALQPGSVFEGLGRQVYECVAAGPATIGSWALTRGETIRVVRPATADLEKLLGEAERLGATGTVLRRLPARGETLGLGIASLAAAVAPGAAEPALVATVEPLPPSRGRRRLRVVLENRNDEPTDFGALETNYLELRLAHGRLGAAARGSFDAQEFLWQGRERRTLRALRQADTLRLSARYVGGRERYESGVVEIRGAGGGERVTITGRFLVPGGREIELSPVEFNIE